MRVVGVVDLLHGYAVHARGGQRALYQPVRRCANIPLTPPGNARMLARMYVENLGLRDLYVADLDAIQGGNPQDETVRDLSTLGATLWLDAGTSSVERARHALALGAKRVVVGLETLPSLDALEGICSALEFDRVVFSLDLHDGEPLVAGADATTRQAAPPLAARAAATGVAAIIVLDLARVGTGRGPDLALLEQIRIAAPRTPLFVGGGIRNAADLDRLADARCNGVLIATALHDGRIGAAALRRAPKAGHQKSVVR